MPSINSASADDWKAADDNASETTAPSKDNTSVVSSGYTKMDEEEANTSYVSVADDNVSVASKSSVQKKSAAPASLSTYVNMDVVDDNVSVASKSSIRSKLSVQSSQINQIVAAVLPKMERLPWSTFLCLSMWCAIPAVVYILLFTQMGFGESFYYTLSHQFGGHAYIPAMILAGYGFFFYILDMDQWNTSAGNIIRIISVASMFVIFVILIMLVSNEFPYGVIALFALFQPLWLLSVKNIIYRDTDTRIYLNWLSGPLFSVALLTIVGFIVWCCTNYLNQWNQVTKVIAAKNTQCSPNFSNYPNCMSNNGFGGTCFRLSNADPPQLVFENNCDYTCVHVYDECSNGFILWVGPILMSLSMIFLGSFCTFLRTGKLKFASYVIDCIIYTQISHLTLLPYYL